MALIALDPARSAQPSDYPQPPRQLHRAVRAGRRHQPVRARAGPEARAATGQAVHRGEPAGRRRRDGGGGGRACHARRLHHHDGVEHGARDQRHHAQEPALRSAQGPHADRAARARAVRAGGQPVAADPLGGRSGQARQGEARPDLVRHARAGHLPPSQRRDVQRHLRTRPRARAVQGLGAGAQ